MISPAECRLRHCVEHPFDPPILHDEREPLQISLSTRREAGQSQRGGKASLGVAQNRKRQPETLRHLALILGRLFAQAENRNAARFEFIKKIAKALELRRRTVGARNDVPVRWVGQTRTPCPGIDGDNAPSRMSCETDFAAICGRQVHIGQNGSRPEGRPHNAQPFSRSRRPFWRCQSRFFSVSRLS